MGIETTPSTLNRRVRVHRALGDAHRLAIVDAIRWSDRTAGELREVIGLSANLLAFHLGVLEHAGLLDRRASDVDARRRYVRLRPAGFEELLGGAPPPPTAQTVLFVCTNNMARSQFAAALWEQATGRPGLSAGTNPLAQVHRHAVAVAADHGLDLSARRPRSLKDVDVEPDLVITVCDRARRWPRRLPPAPLLHWSVPDPAGKRKAWFEAAFVEVAGRVTDLAGAAA